MQHIRTIIILICLCLFANVNAQISTYEKPVSFYRGSELAVVSKSSTPIITTPKLDMAKIAAEDEEDEKYDMPPRFGYSHFVDYNLNNSGTWFELPNGDKLWQLEVVCPGALSVNFCYDKFWIPEGGKFFIYSKDRKYAIGAFTSRNNKGDRENIRGFATGLIYGDNVILEYYQPKEVTTDAIISIAKVVHGYRYFGFGASGDCMVNINCSEGQNWQNEKKAVALIIIDGERKCTGSLINTTNLSETPFFLTAKHCISGNAEENPDLSGYIFIWNYEAPGCDDPSVEPDTITTSGATLVANNLASDFALLLLTEDPKTLTNYTPYYLGWDFSGLSGDPGVCIHHPMGDIKKISTVKDEPTSSNWSEHPMYSIYSNSHWLVKWKLTPHGHGITQEISSGSPLLNAKHRVIGQLHGGNGNDCDNPDAYSKYGKFNLSWIGYNNNSSMYRRLDCWLDPLNILVPNTDIKAMEGLLVISSDSIFNTNQQLYSNIRIKSNVQLTIQSNVEMMGYSRVIVEAGGTLIVDNKTLSNADIVLKPGATLRIINGGIIETRNGFEAPIGTIVEIQSGQII